MQIPRKRVASVGIRTVAKRAGVSNTTVSRVINHVPTVDQKIAKRVWAAISELGYFPNTQARALICGRSGLLGLIVPKPANPFIVELIHSFETAASRLGYGVLISFIGPEPAEATHHIRRMLEHRVEAVSAIIASERLLSTNDLESSAIPFVCIDGSRSVSHGYTLHVDYSPGIRQGVQHLAALGHRRIGFASRSRSLFTHDSAIEGFYRALAECGIHADPSWVAIGENSEEISRPLLDKLLTGERVPTAIVCCSSSWAGVMHAASKFALTIPEDLSVIIFGDHHPSMNLRATSILASPVEVAYAAVNSIRAHQAPDDMPDRRIRIQPPLTVGNSTGFPRGVMKDLQLKSPFYPEAAAAVGEPACESNSSWKSAASR
jgi:DNA-binding LacI/PurR family transcriptional regulator